MGHLVGRRMGEGSDRSMLVVLKKGVSESAVNAITARLRMFGLSVHRTDHDGHVRLGALGDAAVVDWPVVRIWPEVESIEPIRAPFKLVSRTFHPHDTILSVGR